MRMHSLDVFINSHPLLPTKLLHVTNQTPSDPDGRIAALKDGIKAFKSSEMFKLCHGCTTEDLLAAQNTVNLFTRLDLAAGDTSVFTR